MSYREVIQTRNSNRQLRLDPHRKNSRGVVNFSIKSETLEHIQKKTEVCWCLKQLKKEFVTEAYFVHGVGRADVYVLDDDVAIEILNSEKEQNLLLKSSKYPCRIVGVRVSDDIDVDYIEKLIN